MAFLSKAFFILAASTYVLCRLCKGKEARQRILLAASYLFYAWWDVRFLTLLIVQTTLAYGLALRIETERAKGRTERARILLAAGCTGCLLVLGFFKYFHFFLDTLMPLTGKTALSDFYIILPMEISFYTFQALSYLIDVYRENLTARRSYQKIALYISFFPQLVAGPIVRAGDFLPQLDRDVSMTRERFEEGIQIFIYGMIKKIVIADRLSVCVDSVFAAPACFGGLSILLAVLSYPIQLYCDFAGYSDMAIGTARILGYDLCMNFNLPFLAGNPSEFWHRWHISLSEWLRDYLYIPLGGNRMGTVRTAVNTMITMLLGGLWHGADWTFVAWGGINGLALAIHKWLKQRRKRNGTEKPDGYGMVCPVILMYLFTCFTKIFFRAQSFDDVWTILSRIITNAPGIRYYYIYSIPLILLVFAAQAVTRLRQTKENQAYYPLFRLDTFRGMFVFCTLILGVLMFYYDGGNAFIYFQF